MGAGETALHDAAQRGHVDVAEELLRWKGDLFDDADRHGARALNYAAGQGHSDLVQLLLDRRASPLAECSDGITALRCAVKSKHVDIARVLLHHGASPNCMQRGVYDVGCETFDSPTLHMAAARGTLQIVQLLLAYGGDMKATANGMTLTQAAEQGQ